MGRASRINRLSRWSGRLNRRQLLVGAAAAGLTGVGAAVAVTSIQVNGRNRTEPPLIGYLAPAADEREVLSALTQFREGLREQGLVEGTDVRLAFRYSAGRPERLPMLAAELLDLGARVIVAFGGTPTIAAHGATDRVPIVSINGPDPVLAGWAVSLARPGGNVTGLLAAAGVRATKNVELLSQIVPTARRLAYLANMSLGPEESNAVAEAAARRGLELLAGDVRMQDELEPAFERARQDGADLVYAQNVSPLNTPRERLPDLARRARLPAAGARLWVEAGCLLGYDPLLSAMLKRGAWYVARILDGNDPAELPIELPTVYELVVNRATLEHLGVTLAPHVADQVTEWIG